LKWLFDVLGYFTLVSEFFLFHPKVDETNASIVKTFLMCMI